MTGGEPREHPAAGQLLLDLVNDTLDPGYRAAAKRRDEGHASPPWFDRPAVAVGCVLIGFVLVVAYVHTHRGEPEAQVVHDRLVQRVTSAESAGNHLAAQVSHTQHRLAAAQARALPASGPLTQRLHAEQQAAGLLAVHGPGFEVTLTAPPTADPSAAGGRAGSTPLTATNVLTDRDVRSVVNELWSDGAEAIGVNGIRLTSTSAIRFAGQAVLVDFQPITSPYTIDAIGNADTLATRFAESSVASRYQTLVSVDDIGFRFSNEDDVSLPAGAEVEPRYAHPLPSASTSPTAGPTPR